MNIKIYKQKEIKQNWEVLSKFITQSIEQGGCDEYDLIDVRRYLEAEVFLGFVFEENDAPVGIIVVSINVYPKQKVGFICAYGGKSVTNEECKDLFFDAISQYNVTKIQGYVRDSMVNLVKPLGFVPVKTLVEHRL